MKFKGNVFRMSSMCSFLTAATLLLALTHCNRPPLLSAVEQPALSQGTRVSTKVGAIAQGQALLWSGNFDEPGWLQQWGALNKGTWGLQNTEVIADTSHQFTKVLRVHYPLGSASPEVSHTVGAPVGGAQFYADLGLAPRTALHLSYYVRFSPTFDFVKGGKLPGLFGGTGNSGGRIPTGTDGFSTRFMWRRQGNGEVYAYLPTSTDYGTSIGRGAWQFKPGVWHHLEQEVRLNQPGKNNGHLSVWFDGVKVLSREDLNFRTTDALKIDGLFFCTFFGGSDASWSTPKDTYADFAAFTVAAVP